MRSVLALVAVAALVATASTSSAAYADRGAQRSGSESRAGHVPTTRINLLAMRTGARPRVPWYDLRTRTIHDGKRRTSAAYPGSVQQLAVVRNGYLLESQRGVTTVVRLIARNGRARVLSRSRFGGIDAVSADGRRVALHRGRHRIALVRLADRHTLRSRSFPTGSLVVDLGPHRALIDLGAGTFWWQGRQLRRYAKVRAETADLSARRVVLHRPTSSRADVASVPRGSRPRWRLPAYESVGPFSADDRRVLTFGHRAEESDPGPTILRVRGVRHGAVQRNFIGGVFEAARWERRHVFLALVTKAASPGWSDSAWVRCRDGGGCVLASPVFRLDVDHEQRSPWLLATRTSGG